MRGGSEVRLRGSARMIMSRTPLRISFLGGGTDIREYYLKRGGAVVSAAIDRYIHIIVNRKFDDNIRVSYSKTEIVDSVEKLAHPLVREALKLLDIRKGIEIVSISDIPSEGTGLGSSSSFTVGLLNALHAWLGEHTPAKQLAEEACRIERDIVRDPGGMQDQYIAAFGGLRMFEFRPDGDIHAHHVLMNDGGKRTLDNSLMLYYTGITRSSSSILNSQIGDISGKMEYYDRMREMAYRCAELLEKSDIEGVGRLLDEGWAVKKSLSNGISNERIDKIYERARKAGAYGGKITGAGGGGFLLLLADPSRKEAVAGALVDLKRENVSIDALGSRIVYVGD
ncbi:MAG: kinase [Candidatus Thermoplasmatota archaeon]|jgi:D-glycero-alpha-D-manno-heptose-7-phosphate kinase|nr:kinase [Candidatus Thermoplasmatota archaeon]